MRSAAEREKQRAVASLEARRLSIEERIRRQQADLAQGRDAIRRSIVGRVHVPSVRAHAGAVMAVVRRADELVLQLAAVQRELDAGPG